MAVAVSAVALGLAALGLWWLTGDFGGLPAAKPEEAQLRLEAIRTALTIAAAVGAGATLLLALRKQSINERAQWFTERDAQEQRITELYVVAVEQLGSDKAAVRLGGLYALERLGNNNPHLRQTVVDVICAYLRMPFTPPAEVLRGNSEKSPHYLSEDAEIPEPDLQSDRHEELEVRLTAQRLLEAHLRAPADAEEPETYWRDGDGHRMNLDLTGATLVKFSLDGCQPGDVRLNRAQFHGGASLVGAEFHGYASLVGAQFYGGASLGGAQLHSGASLGGAQFHGDAWLDRTRFHGKALLDGAEFHGKALLDGAQFHGYAWLFGAQFHDDAWLLGAQFQGPMLLGGSAGLDFGGALVRYPKQLPPNWVAADQDHNGLWRVVRAPAPHGESSAEPPSAES